MEGDNGQIKNDPLSTPVMNPIAEESSPQFSDQLFKTPYLEGGDDISLSDSASVKNQNDTNGPGRNRIKARSMLMSPSFQRPNSLYSQRDGNNSSSSLIYNPAFTFGGGNNSINNTTTTINNNSYPESGFQTPNKNNGYTTPNNEGRRNSLKYIPGQKLAPPTSRNRSPVRPSSPEHNYLKVGPPGKRGSLALDTPFNFSSAPIKPQIPNGPNNQNTPPSSSSRASFRKGHRYKHSSVSMNFFQEPEVKIPLNIAKSLPIPDFEDMLNNLPWPKAHLQLIIATCQFFLCIVVFYLGRNNNWSNFVTLSHFITYDIIGALVTILVENLSQFQVWFTGTITYPFGLNRVDVLLSFGLAVSLCFVGLDLLFHIIEESIVLLVETKDHDSDTHSDITQQIPHSHHSEAFSLADGNFSVWYFTLIVTIILSTLSLYKTYYSNTNSKLKTKNPLVTISYGFYLMIYPLLVRQFYGFADYIATVTIAIFILLHGLKIAEWSAIVLLMGLSTTNLPSLTLLNGESEDNPVDVSENAKSKTRLRSLSTLPVSTETHAKNSYKSKLFPWFSGDVFDKSDPTGFKSKMLEQLECLPEFKSKCKLNYENLIISKVNFNLFIVLMKISMKGGSNDDELQLRLALDKCIKKILPGSETTIEIERI
ncbi:Protein ZRG17 [Nakaseomyces bracarensis]|uniref:Protein ZRG17 n=1 Tax=Nakaseomyces bracarensis TaxID=273131 RepID=A0ABR4NUG6_9SACH